MSDKQASLLTDAQRDYLETNEASNESQMRQRIRERVYVGLCEDGRILADKLDPKERRLIFNNWEYQNSDHKRKDLNIEKTPEEEVADKLERSQLEKGLAGLLQFIYLGTEESGTADFVTLLKDAFDEIAKEQDQYIERVKLSVEANDLITPTIEELYDKFQSGDDDLRMSDLKALYQAGKIDESDLEDAFESPEKGLGRAAINSVTDIDDDEEITPHKRPKST